MHSFLTRPVLIAALSAALAAGTAVIPASVAHAETRVFCNEGVNAGYSNGGSGSTYWGWCTAAAGEYVKYQVEIDCPRGGGGTTPIASGSGPGTIYTQSETCWFGDTISGFGIFNPS
ncbi:hypothetical protein [Nocardia arthritidis]|uniref:Uncharacterized protein n=1 Tax=Nocardia arthritidis TaxID=228602 RepID=A0A6G9YQY6_9NOCA|nr:hypothetical protein [Nocardia arthritidis]QIS15622.1 hypothetical protein F5544_39005 [Nocardia arthritidis]